MSQSLKNILILILLAIIWGSSFILMKRVLKTTDNDPLYSPMALGGLRLLLAGLALSPLAYKALQSIDKKSLGPIAVVGLIGNGIPAFLFALAQTVIPSGMSGILNSITPLWVVVMGVLFFKLKLNFKIVIGILLGFVGAAGLIFFRKNTLLEIDSEITKYSVLILLATVCYGLSVNTISHYLKKENPIHIGVLGLSMAAILGGIVLLFSDFQETFTSHPQAWTGIGYCAILSVVGTAFAVILFNHLVQCSSAVFASLVTYLIPLVALIWGVLDGEKFTWIQGGFGLIILLGVYIVKLGRKTLQLRLAISK